MNETLTAGGLFMEGLLSFFSPCVLPLIPLYIGYLTAGAVTKNEDGTVSYDRLKTLLATLFFCLGICTVFFLMAAGAGALKQFLNKYEVQMQIIGGFFLAVLGLFSFGFIQIPLLEGEKRVTLKNRKGGLLGAWLMGFFFSFAWSPCIGPLLASALMASASASTSAGSFLLIGAYSLGFILMFILLGMFTEEVLVFLQKHRDVVKYTEKLGAAAVTCMGCWMIYQSFKTINILQNSSQTPVVTENGEVDDYEAADTEGTDVMKYDFSLADKDGQYYSLSQYTGKTVLLNFFGTWCSYCNMELPALQNIQDTQEDVQVLLVAAPNYGNEKDIDYIEEYMSSRGYTMKILYDTTLKVTMDYGVEGYPMTYIVKPDGNFLGYVPGYADQLDLEHYIDIAQEEVSE